MTGFLLRACFLMAFLTTSAMAAPPIDEAPAGVPGLAGRTGGDDLPHPLGDKQRALKAAALEARLNGKALGRTHEVARGQFVELAREGQGMVWTVIGEFPDLLHNSIAAPDRQVDNTTYWVPDFSRDHYMQLMFDPDPGRNSVHNYFVEQSSNRYAIAGDVTEWVQVPGTAASYDDNPDANVWNFIRDAVNGWYSAQIAAGATPAEIDAYLAQFDVWDRYDYNGNGSFDEPDGYIDTVQFVHAGEGEEAGGGVLGAQAIWSHSWYAHYELRGVDGPAFNKSGGVRIGNSAFWVGKYTIQPENGAVGVFTHEFGHDLGLPDLYDTSGGENGTAFWTLMSSGSWMGDGTVDIGSKSSHMGAWEKFQLGWLNYEVARAGKKSEHKIGPLEANTKQAQGLFVVLPRKAVVKNVGAPFAGSAFYYSGAGDNLNAFMYRPVNLAPGSTLAAKVKYSIELDWDYAYVVVSTDGGATWSNLATNLSTGTNPNGQNLGQGITGTSSGWIDLTADLPAGNVLLGFRYWTDGNTGGFGLQIDDIVITGYPIDGAETFAGWTFAPTTGFHVSDGIETTFFNHYYVAEFRQYRGYDATLGVGPYYFGYMNNPVLVNFVDHFAYQDGLLVNYWDTSQKNNQTRVHPGAGLLLPIDAHPANLVRVDGASWRNRIQSYDSTFGLTPTDGIPNIHVDSVLSPVGSLPAVPVFDDRNLYYDPANPQGSVINPNTGTRVKVTTMWGSTGFMQVQVSPAK